MNIPQTTITSSQHHEPHTLVGGFLKEAVFGFNDGIVSTFAVIAGLSGGAVEHKTVLLAALATLFAGAFSMGLGTYIGSKAEKEHYEGELAREKYEVKHMPEAERQEIREIYAAKGFSGKLLEDVVEKITKDEKVWIDVMMKDELGFAEAPPKPGINGVIMSVSFTVGSLLATFAYFFPPLGTTFGMTHNFLISLGVSVVALLIVGGYKTKFTKRNWALSAIETLAIGTLAAGATYLIGLLFS